MRTFFSGFTLAIVIATVGGGGSARAQQATPQYYGYPSAQQAVPSGQANYTCQPAVTCQPTKYGCNVTVCPCPCTTANTCQAITAQIPPIHPVPTCQEANVCTIIDEGPPTTPLQNITIYRNCYVPIKVVHQPGPRNVTPVNITVNWREVHVLCGIDGKPLSTEQAAAALKQLNEQTAATTAAPAATEAPAPPVAPTASPTTAAPAAVEAVENAPAQQKSWAWLPSVKGYGFGYYADGHWMIDQGSYRATLPAGQTAVNVVPTTNATMTTASN